MVIKQHCLTLNLKRHILKDLTCTLRTKDEVTLFSKSSIGVYELRIFMICKEYMRWCEAAEKDNSVHEIMVPVVWEQSGTTSGSFRL